MNPRRVAASAVISILLGLLPALAAAAGSGPVETWRRSEALAVARSVDATAAVNRILRSTARGRGEKALQRLQALETRSDWPLPAREAALYRLTRQLAQLPRSDAAVAVQRHLRAYRARTLVPQEEHAAAAEPLFNIHAAAIGVENAWLRRAAKEEASGLLQTDPTALVDRFLQEKGNARRSGFLEALRYADPVALEAVRRTARERLENAPDLTPLLGAAAGAAADTGALEQLLIEGRGAALAGVLKRAAATFMPARLSALLRLAVERAPPANAALAIAEWWPALRHEDAARNLLLGRLADPDLGEAAALALAQSPDVTTIRALQSLAKGDSITARRARLALAVNRDVIVTETPR